jgi:glycosyltransferase involved in cell wall biosynthesis
LWAAVSELICRLKAERADILCCHGYKANLVGRIAARWTGIPVVAVARGWTGENFKIRLYEAWDRRGLRKMDRIVCVSGDQAKEAQRCGANNRQISVIRNSISCERFSENRLAARRKLLAMLPREPQLIVGAAGRLSIEKGFDVLIHAARELCRNHSGVAFVVFGEGNRRACLQQMIKEYGLQDRFVLPGYRRDLDELMPGFDVFVLPSHTEGLPNVVLEAFAAGVPVVATRAGGTPEVIEEGKNGLLITPGDRTELAAAIAELLASPERRRTMGAAGRARVQREFDFGDQASRYQRLFESVLQEVR